VIDERRAATLDSSGGDVDPRAFRRTDLESIVDQVHRVGLALGDRPTRFLGQLGRRATPQNEQPQNDAATYRGDDIMRRRADSLGLANLAILALV